MDKLKPYFAEYSVSQRSFLDPIDVYRELKRKNVETAKRQTVLAFNDSLTQGRQLSEAGNTLDVLSWLPFAAKEYHLSKNIEDYIIVPCVTINSDLPNRNAVAFPLQELTRWNSEMGMMAYKTFKGKPTFYNHANNVLSAAKGVIMDSSMSKMEGYGGGKVWKVVELLSFDRSKDPDIAKGILDRELNSYSMGAYVEGYTCSYCQQPLGKCTHLSPPPKNGQPAKMEFYKIGEDLVFRNVVGHIVGFETSCVDEPAFHCALSDTILKR